MASYVSLSTVKAEGLLSFGLGTWAQELLILISGLVNVGFPGFFEVGGALWDSFPAKSGHPFHMC